MSEMIERVAKALCLRACLVSDRIENRISSKEFLNKAVEAGYERFINEARTAIEAMREPTEEMMENGALVGEDKSLNGYNKAKDDAKLSWKSMIDAALKE